MKVSQRSGFTLVEIMMSVSLVVLVIGLTTSPWLALGRASSIIRLSSDTHGNLRYAFDRMSRDVVSASAVVDGEATWFRITANRSGTYETVFYVFDDGFVYRMTLI